MSDAPPVGSMMALFNANMEAGRKLLAIAQRTGVLFYVHLNNRYWPSLCEWQTVIPVRSAYQEWCKQHRKRPLEVSGRLVPGLCSGPLLDSLLDARIVVADRVAMRAINAPLQVLSDGAVQSRHHVLGELGERLISCIKSGDGFDYHASTPAGSKAILQILLSEPVQKMIHNKDHYSRARKAGED